jgi:hypothetical protein
MWQTIAQAILCALMGLNFVSMQCTQLMLVQCRSGDHANAMQWRPGPWLCPLMSLDV